MDLLNAFVALANFVLIPSIVYGSQLALGALGVTMIYGILTLSSGEFRYVAAGHPPLIHMPSEGAAYQPSSISSPVGFFPQASYDTHTLTLKPGDRLFLFSDGLIETWDDAEELFGSERLIATIEANRAEALETSIKAIANKAQRWHQSPTIQDDLTLMGLEWSG